MTPDTTHAPKLSGAPDKRNENVIIEGNIAKCNNCHRPLGTIEGRNLRSGEIVLVSHAPIRCRSCNQYHKWKPIV